jgi:hypothetical protein
MTESYEQRLMELKTSESATQPFFYEIHVKSKLSEEKWASWFDNLMVVSSNGDTIIKGTLPDRSALYGMLNRLRDLAIPLISVKVLDAEAQQQLERQSKRYDVLTHILLVIIYLLFVGGLISLTVAFASPEYPANGLTLLFAALGGVAYALYYWSRAKFWRYLSYLFWPATFLTFFIGLIYYVAAEEIVHPGLAIALMFLLCAGGLVYLVYYLRKRSDRVNSVLVDWHALSRDGEVSEDHQNKD